MNRRSVRRGWSAGGRISATAGSKLRLYRDSGGLWFSGYLEDAPPEFAGVDGVAVFRPGLMCQGRDLGAGSSRSERTRGDGRLHGGEAVTALTLEENAAISMSGGAELLPEREA